MSEECEHKQSACDCKTVYECDICKECQYWIGFKAGEKIGYMKRVAEDNDHTRHEDRFCPECVKIGGKLKEKRG